MNGWSADQGDEKPRPSILDALRIIANLLEARERASIRRDKLRYAAEYSPSGMRWPVHISRKETKTLRRYGFSLRKIARLLKVSHTTVYRSLNGRKCRCGGCPKPRPYEEILGLTASTRA